MPAEFDFISWLKAQGGIDPRLNVGIGDDLAVLKFPPADLLLVGVDQVLDSVHFDSVIHSPYDIGRKAMNRNLSDCAAMACLPFAAVATFALPAGVGVDYAKQLHLGMNDAGAKFDCPIVGGDTGSWPGKLVVTVTILGRSAGVTPVTRTGAAVGDGIFVTGPLGGSIKGRHMTFEPRVDLGRKLGASGVVTAMIDLSDGLSRDLAHLCRSIGGRTIGADLDGGAIPIHPDAGGELTRGLNDGEDYELLFTAGRPPDIGVRIGTIVATPGIRLDGAVLTPRGWEHRL